MKSGISVLTLTVLTVLMAGCRQENTMNRNEIPTPVSVSDITYGSFEADTCRPSLLTALPQHLTKRCCLW